MSFLNSLILVVLLVWSWCFMREPQAIPELVHTEIQANVREFITNYIKENAPQIENLNFKKFWSETVTKNQVKTHFTYSFVDKSDEAGPADVELTGFIILNKQPEGNSEDHQWNIDKLYILNNEIVFKNAIEVKANE